MKKTLIVAALVMVVVLVGWFEGFYRPESSHISALNTKEQAAQAVLLGLETRYGQLVDSKKRLPEERAALASLEKAVPTGPELDNLVTTLFSAASAAHVLLGAISSPQPVGFGTGAVTPAPGAPSGPVQLSLAMSVEGTAAQIEHLYRILDAEARLFVIDNCTLTFAAPAGNVKTAVGATSGENGVTLDLRAFYASPNASSAAS